MRIHAYAFALLIALMAGACSNSSGPEDIERISGTFVLQKPPEHLAGYNLLEQENTGVDDDIDFQLYRWFVTGNRLDSLYLSGNFAGKGGGIIQYDGPTAPKSGYILSYKVNLSDITVLPISYYVRCRGDSNYAHVWLDSAGVSADTCRAYFSFTLNLDTYEREFTD